MGANVRGGDSRKRTALHFAATHRGNVDLVRLLLNKGADPNVQDMAGNTPLHLGGRHRAQTQNGIFPEFPQ